MIHVLGRLIIYGRYTAGTYQVHFRIFTKKKNNGEKIFNPYNIQNPKAF